MVMGLVLYTITIIYYVGKTYGSGLGFPFLVGCRMGEVYMCILLYMSQHLKII